MSSKKATNRKGDGLEYLGKRDGKMWWRARLFWLDALTGAEREAQRTFQADSKALAHQQREVELEKAKAGTPAAKAATVDRKRFIDASEAWLATIKVAATLKMWGYIKGNLDKRFGEWFLDLIEPRHLREYLGALTFSNGHVNSYRDVLDHVFEYAKDKGWIDVNPVKDVKRRSTRLQGLDELGEEPKRSLTEEETIAHLRDLEQHEPEAYPLVLLQFHLGCRFSELSALRHEDVDLEKGIVKIRRGQYLGATGRTKGKYARTAGIPLELRAFLKQHIDRVRREGYEGADELVFPRPPYGYKKTSNHWSSRTLAHVIERSYRRLGFRPSKDNPHVENPVRGTTHVARHTVATMAEELATSAVLQKVLGQTPLIHKRYQHPTDAKVIELGDRIGKRLKRASDDGT
jgi:integrase